MIGLKLKPYDVLFLGQGTPFNIGGVVSSLFPPSPHTIAGAVTAKVISLANDPKIIKSFLGPFLFNETERKFYFPKPANIYKKKKEKGTDKIYLLNPVNNSFNLFKPEYTNKPEQVKTLSIYKGDEEIEDFFGFISEDGLKKWLNNQIIDRDDLKTTDKIFEYENRVGIKQDLTTHTVLQEDGIYRVSFVRLKSEWSIVCWFDFKDSSMRETLFNIFFEKPQVLKLGGEMKVVRYEIIKDFQLNKLIKRPEVKKGDLVKLLFLTPGVYNKSVPEIKGLEIHSIVSSGYSSISLFSINQNIFMLKKKAFPLGTVVFGKVTNVEELKKLWLNPSDGEQNVFIGSNLIIYGKM